MAIWGASSPWGLTSWSSGGGVASLPSNPSTMGVEAQDAALGTDIFFNGDYETTAAGDLAVVRGFAAFSQSIYHRIITVPGEFVLRPGYGLGLKRWVKKRNTLTSLHSLEQEAKDQLSLERRVQEVKKVFVGNLPNGGPGIILGFEITTVNRTILFQPLAFSETGEVSVA